MYLPNASPPCERASPPSVAASYPDGVIVLVAPRLHAAAARVLGNALRTTVTSLAIANPESIASDGATVSVGIVSARQSRSELVAEARRLLKDAMSAGGNRVVAIDMSSN
jgi:PleD family two-component response regulator